MRLTPSPQGESKDAPINTTSGTGKPVPYKQQCRRLCLADLNKLTGVEHCRFWQTDFHSCFVKPLENTEVFPAGFALPEQKSAPPKLFAPVSRQFLGDFGLCLMQMGCRPSKRKRQKAPKRGADRRQGSIPVSLSNPSVIADAMPAPLTQGSQWGALHKICVAPAGSASVLILPALSGRAPAITVSVAALMRL